MAGIGAIRSTMSQSGTVRATCPSERQAPVREMLITVQPVRSAPALMFAGQFTCKRWPDGEFAPAGRRSTLTLQASWVLKTGLDTNDCPQHSKRRANRVPPQFDKLLRKFEFGRLDSAHLDLSIIPGVLESDMTMIQIRTVFRIRSRFPLSLTLAVSL
jgi:hypothetical protein